MNKKVIDHIRENRMIDEDICDSEISQRYYNTLTEAVAEVEVVFDELTAIMEPDMGPVLSSVCERICKLINRTD